MVKELDDSTLRLVRHLAENQERLMGLYGLRLFVIWVGGDKEALAEWAAEHDIKDLPLGIISADDETLNPWRINKDVQSTTVLLIQGKPVASLTDLEAGDLTRFEKKVDEHFQQLRRCEGD